MSESAPPRSRPADAWDDAPESTMDPEHLLVDDAERAPPLDDDLGSTRLGRGAGGVVMSGPDRHLPRTVAWKVARGARARARLAHEARVLAALDHPSIVPIHDLVEGHDDSLRIALRMVRGETLHVLVRRAATLNERLRLLRPLLQAVEALAWAHRLGWVHRDVKPANIMIGEFGETQVLDWGLAASLDEAPLDPPGAVVGTLATMAPEQARGEAVSTAFDVWAIGATLFELVSGRPLFEASTTSAETLERVRRGVHVPLVAVAPEAPPELVAIVGRCLATSPEDRYPDARGVADDLTAFLDGRRVSAHAYTRGELLRRFARANRMPIAIAVAVLVTGAVAAVVSFKRIGEERDAALAATAEARAALAQRDREIANSGIVEARRELMLEQRPEAELAAARTLEVRESPEARGVLMALGRTPRPQRLWHFRAPVDCLDFQVNAAGRRALCGTREALSVIALDREGESVWTVTRPHLGAAFIDGGALALMTLADGSSLLLDGQDGRVLRELPPTDCIAAPQRDPSGTFALAHGHSCATTFGALGAKALDPCDTQHIEVASIARASPLAAWPRAAGLCIGGDAFDIAPDGSRRRLPTPIGSAADELLASSLLPDGGLVVASSRGVISVVDLGDGHIRRTARLPDDDSVRSLASDVTGRRLLLTTDAAGPLVMGLPALTLLGRMPRADGQAAALIDGVGSVELVTLGTDISAWSFPTAPLAGLQGLGGVTSAVLDGDEVLLTHDRSVVLVDAQNGQERFQATWDKVIAKQAVHIGDRVEVAIAGRRHGEWLASSSTTTPPLVVEELRAMRRVSRLSRDRKVGSRTGPGLVVWPDPAGGPIDVDERLVRDVAVRDEHVAVLYEAPRESVMYDMRGAPLELGACHVPLARAVALGFEPADPEPQLVAVTPAALVFVRVAPRGAGRPCEVLARYGARDLERAVVSRDGLLVAGGTREGDVHVWSREGVLVATLRAHESAVTSLTMDPTDRFIVSAAWDGRVRLLDRAALASPREALVRAIRSAWNGAPTP